MRSELDTIDHVLRGSLNTILLNLQLLGTSLERDEQARSLVDRASAELRRLATELLPAALRIVSLEIDERGTVDLGQLVEQARAEHGLEETRATRGGPAVVGDAGLLAAALGQLVGNAVAATPAGAPPPQVALDTGPEDAASLVVRNTCVGQAPPLTADGIPAARGHLGGLVAAMRIARLHAGTLTYERRDSELTARLSIPAVSGVDPGTGGGAPGSPPPRTGDSPRRGT
jgi:hypothetical protein